MAKLGLSEETRMKIKARQLSKRLNELRQKISVVQRQYRCDFDEAVLIYKNLLKQKGKALSEETLLDLDLLEMEEHESAEKLA